MKWSQYCSDAFMGQEKKVKRLWLKFMAPAEIRKEKVMGVASKAKSRE